MRVQTPFHFNLLLGVESGNDSYFNIIPLTLQKRTRIFEFKVRMGSAVLTPTSL
jgi:hypothetical protein